MNDVRRPPIKQAAASGIGGSLENRAVLTQGRHVDTSIAHHVENSDARGCGTGVVLIHAEHVQHSEHDASAEGTKGGASNRDDNA